MELGAHVGFVVDPDVDRLAMVCEDGSMFGEEYTLVAVADYAINTIGEHRIQSFLYASITDVTENHGGTYSASAVRGECANR